MSSVQGLLLSIAYEGEGRDGYRDQIVTCGVPSFRLIKQHATTWQFKHPGIELRVFKKKKKKTKWENHFLV